MFTFIKNISSIFISGDMKFLSLHCHAGFHILFEYLPPPCPSFSSIHSVPRHFLLVRFTNTRYLLLPVKILFRDACYLQFC